MTNYKTSKVNACKIREDVQNSYFKYNSLNDI